MTLIGNRVPHQFFVTSGAGESDITVHAGSFHLALRQAGIEMANIMTYSSILPGTAEEVQKPESIVHGCVMETIMAEATCSAGELATAGLIYGWLYTAEGERFGGLVCEYNGPLVGGLAEIELRKMLNELYMNGYEHYQLKDVRCEVRTVRPTKKHGTALVAICFVNYDIPVIA